VAFLVVPSNCCCVAARFRRVGAWRLLALEKHETRSYSQVYSQLFTVSQSPAPKGGSAALGPHKEYSLDAHIHTLS